MRTGIFGGTFDPIHLGHLRVAEEVMEKNSLNRIIFFPAGNPPHRPVPKASAVHRLAMVKAAVKNNPCFEVDDYEVKRDKKSYTVETMLYLKKKYPDDRFYLVLGADQVLTLPKWHRAGELLSMCGVIAMSRPGIELTQLREIVYPVLKEKTEAVIKMSEVSKLEISSTDIRRRFSLNHSVRYLLDNRVMDYIFKHKLYLS